MSFHRSDRCLGPPRPVVQYRPPAPVQTFYTSYFACGDGPGCVLDPYDIIPVANMCGRIPLACSGSEELHHGGGPHLVIMDVTITKWQFVRIHGVEYVEVYTCNMGTILEPVYSSMYIEAIHRGGPDLDKTLLLIIRDSRDAKTRRRRRVNAPPTAVSTTAAPATDTNTFNIATTYTTARRGMVDCEVPDATPPPSGPPSGPVVAVRMHGAVTHSDGVLDEADRADIQDEDTFEFRLIYRIPISAWDTNTWDAIDNDEEKQERNKRLFSESCNIRLCTTVEVPKWLWHWGESILHEPMSGRSSPRDVCDVWWRDFMM